MSPVFPIKNSSAQLALLAYLAIANKVSVGLIEKTLHLLWIDVNKNV